MHRSRCSSAWPCMGEKPPKRKKAGDASSDPDDMVTSITSDAASVQTSDDTVKEHAAPGKGHLGQLIQKLKEFAAQDPPRVKVGPLLQ